MRKMVLISSSPTANAVAKAATAVAEALIEAQKAAVEKAEAEEDEREFMAAMLGEHEDEDEDEEEDGEQEIRGGGFQALPPLSGDASTAIDHFPAAPAGRGDGGEADGQVSKPGSSEEVASKPRSAAASEEAQEARPITVERADRAKLSAALIPRSSEGLRLRASSREVTKEGYMRTSLIERQSYSRQGSAGSIRRMSSAGSSRSSMRRSRASSRESVYGASKAKEEDVFPPWLVRRLSEMQVRRIPNSINFHF